ncbi:hypothetical protein [Luteipulveratus mongoliensis]|uniref:Uncharacterized protein n=1 Tax=Luteipulveratus mongoliensis TaxID=571913 RepID=A0A0K1JIB0_9MICO|nr:hypothetical protein [Luteipulveratus mongoliensis]AKU16441.1 hypothetical protein VV02_12140 [Luteipulveratus mongoliensis]
MRYYVRASELRGDGTAVGSSATGLASTPGDLSRALRAIGAATGCPQLSGLTESLARGWGRSAAGLEAEARALSRGLGATGTAYDDAESVLGVAPEGTP